MNSNSKQRLNLCFMFYSLFKSANSFVKQRFISTLRSFCFRPSDGESFPLCFFSP